MNWERSDWLIPESALTNDPVGPSTVFKIVPLVCDLKTRALLLPTAHPVYTVVVTGMPMAV